MTSWPRVAVHTNLPSGETTIPEGKASPSGGPGSAGTSGPAWSTPSTLFQRQTVTVGASSLTR